MRIKKISPTTPANGNIENQYGTSQTNAYSEEYSNNTFATKDVATTSANGLMSSTDKAKLDNGEVYSTTEQVIGKWIDGKPLYRKTIYSTAKTGSLSLSNVDFLRWKNFNAFVNNEILFPDARYISSTDKLDFFVSKTQKSFTITLGSDWSSKFTYLVFEIEYTKTTD